MTKRGRQGEGGGRPKVVFSDDQIKEVETLGSVLSKGQMADYFGISENTFREIESRQPEVSEAYKRGKAKAIASVSGGLLVQARSGNMTAAIFYLKTQAGWKETNVNEHTSPDGSMTLAASQDAVLQALRAKHKNNDTD